MHNDLRYSFLAAVMFFCFFMFSSSVYAAEEHIITYERMDGTQIGQEVVSSGSAINLPAEIDAFIWLFDECRKVEDTLKPTSDMVIQCVYNSDILAHGTMDGGDIVWFISNRTLYVTGKGTIAIADKYNTGTKKYGFSIGTFKAKNPSVMYEWQKEPTVGDEAMGGYGVLDVPEDKRTVEINVSRPIAFAGETIGVPSTSLMDAAPWSNHASEIETVYFSDDIVLSGNLSTYFNLNSAQIMPTALKESIFRNLKTVYLYADTSAVTRTSGMFARCGELENVLVRSGREFFSNNIIETANMFYGDKQLLCDSSDSILNAWSNFDNVTDARYMFMGCESLNKPMISEWNTSSLRDATGMFAGCNKLGLVCDETSDAAYNISGWDLSNVYSSAFMFAGAQIDMENPTSGFWGTGGEGYDVIGGMVDLDALNLGAVQCAVYMFAQNKALTGIKMTNALPVIEDISAMFAFCPELEVVNMAGLQTQNLHYAVATFFEAGAEGAEADISGANFESLEDARYMFYDSGFSMINLDGTNPASMTNAQGMFAQADKLASLGNDALADWNLSQLKDSSYMFEADKELYIVDVSNWGMDSIENISYMYADCEKLMEVEVSNWQIKNLTQMDAAFMNTAISSFLAPDWDTSNLRSAYRALSECRNLENVSMKEWKCDNLENVNGLFSNDVVLRSLDLSGWIGSKLYDAGGMCFGCIRLETIDISKLVGNRTWNTSYMMSGCEVLHTADLSSWNTDAVEYAQGMFDNNKLLEKLSWSNKAGLSNTISTAMMFRDCANLHTSTLQSVINHFDDLSKDKNMFEMFKGCEKLTAIDLSGISFACAEDLSSFLYQEGTALSRIIIPGNFGVSAKKYGNLFHVGQNTITDFLVTSSAIPTIIKSYKWGEDNRSFIEYKDAEIDGKSRSDYIFTEASADRVKVEIIAESTFCLKDTPLPLTYRWKKGSKLLDESTCAIQVSREDAGKYIVEIQVADLENAGSFLHEYSLVAADHISSITAEYKGNPIPVNHEYDKKDVRVTLYFNDRNDKYTVLSTDSFRVDSMKVSRLGENVYTATYIDAENKTFKDEFVVPGIRIIGEIEAKYEGPVIRVGNDYDTANVTVTAYYEDDKAHKEGFEVIPTGFSDTKVNSNKKNTFVALYEDKEQKKTFKASFDVLGYIPIDSIKAEYQGPDIEVGNDYKKDDVIVTVHFSDGTKAQKTRDFTLDATKVTQLGENSYIVTYTDSYGTKYTTSIIVKGIEKKVENGQDVGGEAAPDTTPIRDNGAGDSSSNSNMEATQSRTAAAGVVKTADEQNVIGWIAFCISVFILIIVAVIYRKKIRE